MGNMEKSPQKAMEAAMWGTLKVRKSWTMDLRRDLMMSLRRCPSLSRLFSQSGLNMAGTFILC